ncbi:apolipoprotein A-IV-like [Littorina saxatilis]|uniref:apolipoprotein A-IV-like n=1 Tax=Littorina saxatilis TaxID=31220 RepID=UPI0038B614C4
MMGVQADFKTDVVSVRSDLQDMVAGVRTEFQDSVAGTRSELQTGFMAAQSGLQNSLQSLHADLMDVRSKAETDVATIRVELSGVTALVKADVQSQLTETRTALLSAQQSLETDLGSQLQDVAARVQHIATDQSQLAYNASTLRQGLNEVKVSAERSLATLKDDLADDLQGLGSRLDDAISALTSELQRQSAQTLADVTNNVTFVDTKLSMLERDLDLQVNSLHADLDSKVGDLEKELKRSQKKMTSERAARKEQVALLTGNMTATHDALQREVARLTNDTVHARGSAFVRWGRSNCTHNSNLVYTGVVGGSSYDTDGGAANRLCLTLEPQAGNVTGARTYIYGAEYKFSDHHDLDVVCSVCHTPLPTTFMVPGTHTCPPGWSEQYTGHLTAGMVGHRAASEYLCLDSNPEHRPGSQEIRNGALFYYVFTECGSLPCPPYANMYVTCVVCSR